MTEQRDELAGLLEATLSDRAWVIYRDAALVDERLSGEWLADVILASDWLKARDAARWDEGQLASVQLHQLLLDQSFLATKANPYRDYPEGDQREPGNPGVGTEPGRYDE